jgi:hypothetical protein
MSDPRFKSAIKRPIHDYDAIAKVIDSVADKSDIGTVVLPSAAAALPPKPAVLQIAPADNVTPMVRKEKAPRKKQRAAEGKLSLMVPDYLLEAIDKKRNRTMTKRFIVLQAFKDAGYEIREADFMEDGRRGRE